MFIYFLSFLQIATKINAKISEWSLRDVGTLEQNLVFGDASSKELINLLTTNQVHRLNVAAKVAYIHCLEKIQTDS